MARLSAISIVIFVLIVDATAATKRSAGQARQGQQTAAEKLAVTVASVTGQAEWLAAGQQDKWQRLKAGDKIGELSVIRTGLRSKVVLKFADRGEVEVGPASKIGIAEFRKRGSSSTTRLGLKYGSMRATVDSTRGPNDTKISTPVATLSVRGSQADIGYGGGNDLKVHGRKGQWRVASGERTRTIGPGESTDGNLTASMELMKGRRDSHMAVAGLSDKEIELITNYRPPRNVSGPGTLGNVRDTAANLPSDRDPYNHIIIGM